MLRCKVLSMDDQGQDEEEELKGLQSTSEQLCIALLLAFTHVCKHALCQITCLGAAWCPGSHH